MGLEMKNFPEIFGWPSGVGETLENGGWVGWVG